MNTLQETALCSGLVNVSELPEMDVINTAEMHCASCDEVVILSTMSFDFDDRSFMCSDCAEEAAAEDDDDVPNDLDACMDELGETDFDADGDF